MLSVDWLVGCGHRPLPDTDEDSAQQQEDHRNPQTDRHHAEDQRRDGVDGRRAGAHQHRPAGNTRRRINLRLNLDQIKRFKSNAPAEELGAVVERFSCQAEAHVQPECLWFCVECSDQTGRR